MNPSTFLRPTVRHLMSAICLLAAATCAPLHAQDLVLQGKAVTESALVEALKVEPQAAASGPTRGFKPAGAAATPTAAAKPASPGRASLLIVFDTNSAVLSSGASASLDTVARALQTDALAGLSFQVEGHADARGDAEANRKLSQLRAEAVVQYLISRHGILAERLTAIGKGSAEPMNLNRIDAPENRRVTIVTRRG